MPFDPATIKQLVDAGGWTVAIAEAIVFGILVLRGAAKRWYVAGWIFDRTEERAEKAETQAERTTEALREMTAVVSAQTTALVAHTTEHAKLVRAMEALRDEHRRKPPSAPPR